MPKRIGLFFVLLCLCVGAAFSLDSKTATNTFDKVPFSLSAGARIFYNGMFDIFEYSYSSGSSSAVEWASKYYPTFFNNHGFGISGFFDATYVEIGIDFIFGSFKSSSGSVKIYTSGGYMIHDRDFDVTSTQFGFSLLGKYPFGLGEATLFPLLGIDYQMFISGKVKYRDHSSTIDIDRDDLADGAWHPYSDDQYFEYEVGMLDAFSIAAGCGLDYKLTDRLYLRSELLLNFKINGNFEKKRREEAEDYNVYLSLFTFGPRFSIGVGYKFF
jgi:hypothetical protein